MRGRSGMDLEFIRWRRIPYRRAFVFNPLYPEGGLVLCGLGVAVSFGPWLKFVPASFWGLSAGRKNGPMRTSGPTGVGAGVGGRKEWNGGGIRCGGGKMDFRLIVQKTLAYGVEIV